VANTGKLRSIGQVPVPKYGCKFLCIIKKLILFHLDTFSDNEITGQMLLEFCEDDIRNNAAIFFFHKGTNSTILLLVVLTINSSM
jgi:hypothetical protein